MQEIRSLTQNTLRSTLLEMPRDGFEYTITEDWQKLVRDRLKPNGFKSLNALGTKIGCGRTTMWQIMQPGAKRTCWMPEINKALGLEPPVADTDQLEAEALKYFRELSEVEKGRQIEKLRRAVDDARAKRGATPRKTS